MGKTVRMAYEGKCPNCRRVVTGLVDTGGRVPFTTYRDCEHCHQALQVTILDPLRAIIKAIGPRP